MRSYVLVASSIIAIIVLLYSIYQGMYTSHMRDTPEPPVVPNTDEHTPNFSTISDTPTLKREFFTYLLPKVRGVNAEIMQLRTAIESNTLPTQQLAQLATIYKTTPEKLLTHIDIIPPSLVLAQAAIESNWGRSRFAKYNNFFGIWCFKKGCGVVPLNRDSNAKHEVATFETVSESVQYYMRMLNSHPAYAELRALRTQMRAEHSPLSGSALAHGLLKYSGIGEKYITTIQNVIKYNNLSNLDNE